MGVTVRDVAAAASAAGTLRTAAAATSARPAPTNVRPCDDTQSAMQSQLTSPVARNLWSCTPELGWSTARKGVVVMATLSGLAGCAPSDRSDERQAFSG